MARRTIAGSRVLITGASSGIGRALALSLAREGASLLLTARRANVLDELAEQIRASGGEVETLAGDITDAAHQQRLMSKVETCWGALDALVNNAGIGAAGRFDEAAPERAREIMEVNYFAPVHLIRAALPLLAKGRRPIIVNIGSILGHRAIPRMSEYCASKFALRGFSEALRPELARQGIDLLMVSPGRTETDFFDNLIEGKENVEWQGVRPATSESVADATVRAMKKGKREIIPHSGARLLAMLNRLSPAVLDRFFAYHASRE